MTLETIVWIALGVANGVSGVILVVVLRLSSRITTMRDNELKHIYDAIKELTRRFNHHTEQHPQ